MSEPTKKGLVPVLRFPEFRDAGEWEQLPIGDKVDLLSGYPFKSEEISEDASGIPLMRGGKCYRRLYSPWPRYRSIFPR